MRSSNLPATGSRVLAVILLLSLPLPAAAGSTASLAVTVPLVVHIARKGGEPVTTRERIEAMVSRANELFAPARVSFELAKVVVEETLYADVTTVPERHSFAAKAGDAAAVHVFMIGLLADKDRSGRLINGVHWRYRGRKRKLRGRRYVMVAKRAYPSVLAHELGHYFGLKHETDPRNLMTVPKRLRGSTFNSEQLARMRGRIEKAVRRMKRARKRRETRQGAAAQR